MDNLIYLHRQLKSRQGKVPGRSDNLRVNPAKQYKDKHSQCLICGSAKLKPLRNYYKEHGLVKCGACGFVFMERIPSPDELSAYYRGYDYTGEAYLSPLTVVSYQRLLDGFEKYRKTNWILDLGCGRGWFLMEAKKRNWQVFGTEYSEAALEICRANGLSVEKSPEAGGLEEGSFDIVTSFEVIEHVNDPILQLKQTQRLLRSGGLFYCTTPNFNSLLRYYLKASYNVISYPEHLSYFTKSTLNHAAKLAGLHPVKFLTTGISITRIRTSKRTSSEALIAADSADEILRQQVSKKWYLGTAKKMINYLLTVSKLGMTLKGYYEKR